MRAFQERDREYVVSFYSEWLKYRSGKGEGILDKAFEDRDPDRVSTCLQELSKLNRDFMRIGTKRFAEMADRYWKKEDES